jgi:uncharacterized membrane protein YbhN (UPF0104 family)
MKIKVNKRLKFIFRLLVAAIFVFLAFRSIGGIGPVIEVFSHINPWLAVATGLCPFVSFFLTSFNVWLLLKTIKPIPYGLFLRNYANSFALSLFIPGQLGDASLTLFLRKHDIPLAHSSLAYMVDKSTSVSSVFLIVWLGTYFILPSLNSFWFLLIPVFGILAIFVVLAAIFYLPFKFPLLERLRNMIREITGLIKEFRSKWYLLFVNFGITLVNLSVVGLSYYLAFLSFNVPSNYFEVTTLSFASSVIGYIPVSLAGIGIVEYTAINLFGLILIEKQFVLSVYVLQRLFQYFLSGSMLLVFLVTGKFRKNRVVKDG